MEKVAPRAGDVRSTRCPGVASPPAPILRSHASPDTREVQKRREGVRVRRATRAGDQPPDARVRSPSWLSLLSPPPGDLYLAETVFLGVANI